LLPKNSYGYARTRAGLFNNKTVNNLLTSSNFNKEPTNPNINYKNIGHEFMNELSKARNFMLPHISSEKYYIIGKIVNKYQLNGNNDNRNELVDNINGLLNSYRLPLASRTGNLPDTIMKNTEEFNLQNTLNMREKTDFTHNSKDNTNRTELIVKGLMGSNDFYKSSAAAITEAQNDNRLGGSKTKYDKVNNYGGYTTKYRPIDPRKKPNPYDSIWELFKQ